MNIRLAIRTALLEGKHKTHKNQYGCLMVYLDADKEQWGAMEKMIEEDDLYNPEDDPSYGKELTPHVTILYGLHEDIPEAEIEEKIEKIKAPKIKVGGISAFKNDKFEVLKFDIDSQDMHDLNKDFREFPYTNDYPKYHPHCTIAYLKPNMADKYIEKLKDLIHIDMEPSSIVYSKADGSKNTYQMD
jgi:2'-5' RNA ligase